MKTRQDVADFERWGKENKVIAKMISNKVIFQPSMYGTGYYSAPSWNWAYQFGIVKVGNKYYELMTQFGGVCGGREIYMDKYTAKRLKELAEYVDAMSDKRDPIAEAYKKGYIDGGIEILNASCELCNGYPMTADCNNGNCHTNKELL